MRKLLNSSFYRLFKSNVFWLGAGTMAFYALYLCCAGYFNKNEFYIPMDFAFESGFGMSGKIPVCGFLAAVFVSLFISVDFSDGVIRNKLCVGHSRTAVYLANFITCAVAGLIFNIIYFLIITLVGTPIFGAYTFPLKQLVQIGVAGIFMIICYAAVFNFIAMLLKNRAIAAVTCLLLMLFTTFSASYLFESVHAEEFITGYATSQKVVDGEIVTERETVKNPMHITPQRRALYQAVLDIAPTGNSVQISANKMVHPLRMPLFSGLFTLALTICGIALFKRADLK